MKKKLIMLIVSLTLLLSMIPISGYALGSNQDRNYISSNLQLIADYIDANGYVNKNGNMVMTYVKDNIDGYITIEGSTLHFSYGINEYGREEGDDVFVDMYVNIPASEYITVRVAYYPDITTESPGIVASAALDPADYVYGQKNILFGKVAGFLTIQNAKSMCCRYFDQAFDYFDDFLWTKMQASITSLGFSQMCSHIWDDGYIVSDATCEKDGSKVYTCYDCGLERYETIPATGHSYNSGVITKQTTCTTNGEKTFTCGKCGGTKSEVIPATGHSYNNGITKKQATCLTEGIKTFTCKTCGNSYNEAVPAIGHKYNSGSITEKAGKNTEGEIAYTCLNDSDHEYYEEIPALNLKIKAKQSLYTVKATKAKKKAQTITKPISVKGAKTKVTYTKSSGKAYFTVNKSNGSITVKKGTKKGTYKIKVKVKTASSKKYKATTTTVTIKIKVK